VQFSTLAVKIEALPLKSLLERAAAVQRVLWPTSSKRGVGSWKYLQYKQVDLTHSIFLNYALLSSYFLSLASMFLLLHCSRNFTVLQYLYVNKHGEGATVGSCYVERRGEGDGRNDGVAAIGVLSGFSISGHYYL
jgi:hypothetical protein